MEARALDFQLGLGAQDRLGIGHRTLLRLHAASEAKCTRMRNPDQCDDTSIMETVGAPGLDREP
jgi:hypothetical protein